MKASDEMFGPEDSTYLHSRDGGRTDENRTCGADVAVLTSAFVTRFSITKTAMVCPQAPNFGPNFHINHHFHELCFMRQPPGTHWQHRADDSELNKATENINFDRLCQIAFSLRREKCTIDPTKYTFGGVNIVFEIAFEDHVFWIVRIRRPDEQYPLDGTDHALESDVATMRFLRQKTKLPIPSTYDYDARFGPQNRVGMPYILMEAMP